MSVELWKLLAGYLLLVNLAGFLLMGLDKRRARRGAWRISEKALFPAGGAGREPGRHCGDEDLPPQDEALVFPVRAARSAGRSAGAGCPSRVVCCKMNGRICNIKK